MTDEQATDGGLEREFADVLGVLRGFELAAAPAGFEGRVQERVAMTLEQVKPTEPASTHAEVRGVARISLRCTYCHAALARDEATFCAACLAPHHDECWVEHGRCTAAGCAETRVVRPREGAQRPTARRRATRRWSRLLVVTAGLTGGLGVLALRTYFAPPVVQLDDEKQMFELFKRLKAEGLKAFGELNRAERAGDTGLARAKHAEAHEKLMLAMDLLTKILDRHRDPSTGFTLEDDEGYELDQSEVAEMLVDLEKRPTFSDRLLVEAARQLELSKIAASEGRVVDATEHLRKAVELDPTNAQARDLLARLEPLADGVKLLNERLESDPLALTVEARGLLGRGRVEEALERIERALTLDPTSGFAHLVRAEVRVARGDLDEAVRDLSRAIELGQQADAYRLRGRVTLGRGELGAAIMDLLRATELDPGAPGALADFDRAVALDPSSDRAYYGRACVKAQQGDLRAAHADLDRAIELNPVVAAYFLLRGQLRERLGDPAGAAADAEWAAELDARNRR